MRLAFVCDQMKRELMQNFCLAYKMILKNHELFATETTGNKIIEATGLPIKRYLPGPLGGAEQLITQIKRDEIDAVFYFRTPEAIEGGLSNDKHVAFFERVTQICDEYCIPLATNIATAEAVLLGIAAGDLNWRG